MLALCLLLSAHSINPLYAQEPTHSGQQVLSEKFGNNPDYRRAEELRLSGREIDARPYYEKAIAAAEAEGLWEMYLLSQAYLAASYAGAPDFQKGIKLASAALEKMETLPHKEKKHAFRLYLSLSNLYRLSYQSQALLATNQKALELVLAHYPGKNHPYLAEAYLNLGKGYYTLSQLDQALAYFKKAETMLDQLAEKNAIALRPSIFSFIGALHARIGKLEIAAKYLEEALAFALIAKEGKEDELFEYYQDIGRVYSQLNEHEKSIAYYKKAVYILENQESKDPRTLYMQLPMSYLGIAESYSSIQDYDNAMRYCQKTVDQIERGGHRTPPFITLYTYLHFGKVYFRKYELAQALSYAQKADSLYTANEALMRRNRIFQALSLHIDYLYAMVYTRMDSLDQAIVHLRQIQQSLAQKTADERKDFIGITSNTLTTLADVYRRKSQLDSAFIYNQKAVVDACQNFNNLDHWVLPAMENCQSNPQIFFILNQKAELYHYAAQAEQNPATKQAYLEGGLATIDLVDEIYAENLKKINILRGGQSAALIRLGFEPYQTGTILAVQHHQVSNQLASIEKGFYYTQKTKAQQLWLSMLKSEATQFGKLDQAILEKERDLLANIARIEKERQEALAQGDTEKARSLEHDQLFHQEKEYNQLQRHLELQYPDYFESKYVFAPENSKSLQPILTETEALIEYAFKDSSLLIFTLTKDTPFKVVEVPVRPQTLENMERLHNMLKQSSMMRKSSREKFIDLSHHLYRQFIEPIKEQIKGKSKLVIIGDRVTNYLPFEALVSSNEPSRFHEMDFLIKSFEISYHYSATLLAKARRKARPPHKGIYAFAPIYDDGKEEKLTARGGEGEASYTALRAINEQGKYARLPESENEVKAIVALFREHGTQPGILALREQADENSLKENLSQPYQFIHIAGHSFANVEHPKFSGIACFEEAEKDSEDGVLYTGEIYNISTQADLVTLSSCESGYGKLALTEGMLGLNRAFIYAGTPNVVFSLWKVYDKVSAQLMVDFYEQVLAGKSYAASLRDAKLKLLHGEATAAPHYWSPYLLIGR